MSPKLSLHLDDLSVETFATGEANEAPGTVFAHSTTANQRLCGCETDEASCDGYGCGGSAGCGSAGCEPSTYEETCATGSQRLCGCW